MSRAPRDEVEPDTRPASFLGAARVVAGLTLLSRVAGLVRDAVCSRLIGAGAEWSAFAFAFLLPNLLRRLFGEGALTGAFVPEYAALRRRDEEAGDRFASAALLATVAAVGLVTVLGEAALLVLLTLTPLGESGGLTLSLAMILMLYAPLICVTALLGGVLQTHDRFAPTASVPVILNLCIITGVVGWRALGGDDLAAAVRAASVAVLVAGALQVAWSFWALRGTVRWTRVMVGAWTPMRRMARRMLPVIVGLGALQINTLLDGLIAGWPVIVGPTVTLPLIGTVDYPLDEASNATLFFAHRLYQFPLGVFGLALATAVFPLLARQADDPDAFIATLRKGVRLTLFIGLPASVGLIAVRADLTAVVFGGGLFDARSVERVAGVLLGYAPAVWAYALTHTLTRAYYARGDTGTPMRVSLIAVAANLALNLALIWPLREAGLAWSTAVCAAGQTVALAALWSRRRGVPILDDQTRRSVLWALGLALLMGLVLAGLHAVAPAPESWSARLVRLAVAVAAGAGVYLGGGAIARRPEIREMLERSPRA